MGSRAGAWAMRERSRGGVAVFQRRATACGMAKLVRMVATTVFSAAGWWLGAKVGMFTAFLASVVLGGLGLYLANWLVRDFLP